MSRGANRLEDNLHLQITPMASLFTVILVLLLQTYSASGPAVVPSPSVRLPASAQADPIREAMRIEVSPGAIRIDDRVVVTMAGFSIPPAEIEPDGGLRTVKAALLAARSRPGAPSGELPVLVLADERAPYATLRPVVHSLVGAGQADLQLVVIPKQ